MRRFKDSTENKRSIAKFKLSFRCVKTENTKHCATHWTVEVRCLLKTKSRTNRPLYKWIIYKDLLHTQNSLWWIQTNEWYIISLEVSLLTSCVIEKPFANAWLGFKISNQRDLIKAPGVKIKNYLPDRFLTSLYRNRSQIWKEWGDARCVCHVCMLVTKLTNSKYTHSLGHLCWWDLK